jgi:hypothetical protein
LQYSQAIVNFIYAEKTQETQTAKQLRLQEDSVFATSVPLTDNTACAAFTSTPERALTVQALKSESQSLNCFFSSSIF